MQLHIAPEALEAMRQHAERVYPNECCGFFYGRDEDENRFIERASEVVNSKEGDQRRRFEVSPADYMKAEKFALEQQTTLLGVYHSHPEHPAVPSEHDRVQAMPFFSYIIISVRSAKAEEVRSWQLNEGQQFYEESIADSH